MVCAPKVMAASVQVATPVEEFHATLQGMVTPLSVKVTVPVSLTEPPEGLMVAVKVTGWLMAEGFAEDVSAVELAPELTVCVRLLLLEL